MRLSVRGLTGKPVRLADALGDWRAEVVSRLAQAGIEGEWDAPEDLPQTLSARAYVQTTRILREATSNIIKHSGASHCSVTASIDDGDFQLVVQDNGDGIATEIDRRLDRGHGLASMKNRAKQLQGQCLVESGPGYGTVIRLTVPLDRAIGGLLNRRGRADNIEIDHAHVHAMKTILLLEDLPEIRAWLRKLVLEVFPGAHLSESARVHDAIELVGGGQVRPRAHRPGPARRQRCRRGDQAARRAARGAERGGDDPRRRRTPVPGAAGRRLRLHPEGTGARAHHRAAAAHQPGRAAAERLRSRAA